MGNVLSDDKKKQVVALGQLGWALRRIQAATGVRRETASAYLRAAGIAVRSPGRWGHAPPKAAIEVSTDLEAPTAKPAIEVSTDSGAEAQSVAETPSPSRSPSASACEPHRELIQDALSRGRNAMAIWQDLVDDHGFSARYSSVKRYVRKLQGETPPEARVVIETPPGQEGQVDYGEGPMVRNALTGKYQRTRLFVFTLGCSRKSVRLLAWKSSSRAWAEMHETSFRRLGGAPRVIVLDNLREGVLKPDIYDPSLNPLYSDVLKHYGSVAIPAASETPTAKGRSRAGSATRRRRR